MKTSFQKEIIKFAVVEILMQFGFEKVTESTLNILTDTYIHFIDSQVKSIKDLISLDYLTEIESKYNDFAIMCCYDKLLSDFYCDSLYEVYELKKFIDQQTNLCKNLIEKYNYNVDENNKSLLHILRLLPRKQSLQSLYKTLRVSVTTQEKKSDNKIKKQDETSSEDFFLDNFINECEKMYENVPSEEIKGYMFDLSKIVERINEDPQIYKYDLPENDLINFKCDLNEEEQFSIFDDFGEPKYKLINKSL
ncbi:Y551 [Hepatospora eriocheir]|uniref:Y551 n=2 Tax=Hepatospora eriocheir TaxID=1081669 RepID=A0A1X0QHX3_9MICR|nr:Y551 [Hepatospora eriocheir]